MMLGRIVGSVVASAKHPALDGKKLLVVQPVTSEGHDRGKPLVALDAIGAGYRETVYWCRGKEAALAFGGDVPCDASIVGIVDAIIPVAPAVPNDGPVAARNDARTGLRNQSGKRGKK